MLLDILDLQYGQTAQLLGSEHIICLLAIFHWLPYLFADNQIQVWLVNLRKGHRCMAVCGS